MLAIGGASTNLVGGGDALRVRKVENHRPKHRGTSRAGKFDLRLDVGPEGLPDRHDLKIEIPNVRFYLDE